MNAGRAKHEDVSAAAAAVLLVTLVVASVLVALPALTKTPFYTKGEPREALVVQAIARGDGFVLPLRNADEIPSKPPFFHWLGAAVSTVASGGVTEASVRAPSLVASVLALVATAASAWRWWGPLPGLLAGLVLATSFQWLASSVTARVDMVLASLVTLALLGFARSLDLARPVPAWVFVLLTAATLTKGPIGIVLPCLVALATLALRGDLTRLGLREARLLGACVGAAGLWYLLAIWAAGDAFVATQILKENVFRVLDPDAVDAGHVRPLWYYLPLIAAGFAPWSLFLPGLAMTALGARTRRTPEASDAGNAPPQAQAPGDGAAQSPFDPHAAFAAVWAVVTVLLFSAAGSKRSVYLLPAYPALALLAAFAWKRVLDGGVPPAAKRLLQGGAFACSFLLALVSVVLIAIAVHLPVDGLVAGILSETDRLNLPATVSALRESGGLAVSCGVLILAAAVVSFLATRNGDWARVVAATATAVLATAAAASTTVLPALAERRSPRDFIEALETTVPQGAPLSFYGTFDYAAVFYRRAPIPMWSSLADAGDLDGAWLLTRPDLLAALAEEVRLLDTGDQGAGTRAIEQGRSSDPNAAPVSDALVLVRIVRQTGDERPGGN